MEAGFDIHLTKPVDLDCVLAIVEKAMLRMGGSLELTNAPDGGLMAHIRLKSAP